MPPSFFDTVLDQTISTSTPAKVVDVSGYASFSILARFEGPPGGIVYFEINHNNLLVARETLTLNQSGWRNFAKRYPVHAPNIGIVFYGPPQNLKVQMTVYAAT